MGQCCSCSRDVTLQQTRQYRGSNEQVTSVVSALTPACRAAGLLIFVCQSFATEEWSFSCTYNLQGNTKLDGITTAAETPVSVQASSVSSSLTPSGTEKRHRAVAASPTRFFELLVSQTCQPHVEIGLLAAAHQAGVKLAETGFALT